MSRPPRATEQRNERTIDIDTWPSEGIITAILAEEAHAIDAARTAAPALAIAVEQALVRTRAGGVVHYFGAGASGRLALLDATEATPTFGAPPGFFTPHFPGGTDAFMDSTLDFEDAEQLGSTDAVALMGGDVAVGITASGTTAYVAGALTQARESGALTILLTCNEGSPLESLADLTVVADTGPEVVTGSTRMKAGTATKVLLNAFSTTLMIRSGRTYSNLMVDLVATNDKLRERAVAVIEMATGLDSASGAAVLALSHDDLPVALVHALTGRPVDEATTALDRAGSVRAAIDLLMTDDR